MLSVHGGIVGGDGSVFEEVELVSVGRCDKYSCVAPVNVVLHVVAMFGRGGFYVVILIWISVMNTLYVRCQTKDYILDIVAARAGMWINKVNSILVSLRIG